MLNGQRVERGKALNQIPGTMPGIADLPGGCAYHPRCERAYAGCHINIPEFEAHGARRIACFRPLIEKAEAEANAVVSEAQNKADTSIAEARKEAEGKRLRAQRRTGLEEFLAESEAEAEKEAKKVKKEYNKRVKEIMNTSDEKIKEAVDFVLKEVLPQ